MKKFLLVLSALAFFSAANAEARGFNNHHNNRPEHQQIVINNYNHAPRHNSYRQINYRQPAPAYHYRSHKRDKGLEVAAITLGVVGVAAIVGSIASY